MSNLLDSVLNFMGNQVISKNTINNVKQNDENIMDNGLTPAQAAKVNKDIQNNTVSLPSIFPSFNNIVTVVIGILLVTLGIIFIGENNKIIQAVSK